MAHRTSRFGRSTLLTCFEAARERGRSHGRKEEKKEKKEKREKTKRGERQKRRREERVDRSAW